MKRKVAQEEEDEEGEGEGEDRKTLGTLTLRCTLLSTELKNSLHSAVLHDHELFVFGGLSPGLHHFNFSNCSWDTVVPSGGHEPNLQRHYLCAAGRFLLAWGGCNGLSYHGNVYAFDTVEREWRTVKILGSVAPKWHAGGACALRSALLPHRMVIVNFGGYDGSYLGDTWELEVEKDAVSGTWRKIECAWAPSERSAVAYVYRETRDSMLVIGGVGNGIGDKCEVFEYACRRETWSEMKANSGSSVPCRSGARAALVQDRYVMVFGDAIPVYFVMFDLDTRLWSVINLEGYDPRERNYPVVLYHRHRNSLILYGGESGPKYSGTCPDLCEVELPFMASVHCLHLKLWEKVGMQQLMDVCLSFAW